MMTRIQSRGVRGIENWLVSLRSLLRSQEVALWLALVHLDFEQVMLADVHVEGVISLRY